MARDRDQQHDLSNTLTMLHATLVQTGSNLQDALSRGLEKVETGNQTAQRGTTDMVVAELSRMRTDLRDTKNRLAANREELSEEVRTALTLLRQEIHKVKDAVENAPATEAEPPESGALPSSDGPYTPVAPHPDGAPGPAAPAIQPAATVTDPPPAPGVQNTDLPLTHSVSLPAQRSSDENDQTPDFAEQLQQTLRTVLADELRDVLAAVAGVQQSQASALNEQRQELAEIRGELAALAADLEGWQVRQTAAGPGTDAPDVTEDHSILLQQAARISSAVLVCHRDMWDFVAANAGRHPHFRIPPQITDHGGERVSTTVSGRSLIAVLISLYDITHTAAKGDGDWELATTLYGRIQHQLTTLDSDGDPVTITLDDRAQPIPEPMANTTQSAPEPEPADRTSPPPATE